MIDISLISCSSEQAEGLQNVSTAEGPGGCVQFDSRPQRLLNEEQ